MDVDDIVLFLSLFWEQQGWRWDRDGHESILGRCTQRARLENSKEEEDDFNVLNR